MLKTGFGKNVHIRGFVNEPTICCVENSVDPDQHSLSLLVFVWFHTVLIHVYCLSTVRVHSDLCALSFFLIWDK